MNMKLKVSIAAKIVNALQDKPENRNIRTPAEVAKFIHGDSYNKKTAGIFILQIKQNINVAEKLAGQHGLHILPDYFYNKKTGENNGRIRGWRIFDLADSDQITALKKQAEQLQKNAMARINSTNRVINFAQTHSISLDKKLLELKEVI